MKKLSPHKTTVGLFLVSCVLLFTALANSQYLKTGISKFVRTELAGGISVEVPRGWTFTNANGKQLIETSAEALWDLLKIPHGPNGLLLNITALGTSGNLSITVVLEDRAVGTEQDIQQMSKAQLASLDKEYRQDIEAESRVNGLKIVSWGGTTVEKVGQYLAIVKRYTYTMPDRVPRQMENYQFFFGNRLSSFMFQTDEKTSTLAKPIFEGVKSTIVFK